MKISEKDLLHHKLQAIIRENEMPSDQLMYLGFRDDDHWYLIAGKHEVLSICDQIFYFTNF